MIKNMGNIDRIIRLIVAIIIGYLFFKGIIAGVIGTVLMVLAAIFLITSLIGFCPLYKPLGINTCERK